MLSLVCVHAPKIPRVWRGHAAPGPQDGAEHERVHNLMSVEINTHILEPSLSTLGVRRTLSEMRASQKERPHWVEKS